MHVKSEKEMRGKKATTRCMEELNYCLTKMIMTTGGATTLMERGRCQEVGVGRVKFEMPVIFSSGGLNPAFRGEIQDGDRKF